MGWPFLTSSAWVASKYGSEKSKFSSRAGVMLMAAAATSQRRVFRSSPDWMPSNGVSTIFCWRPMSLAIASTRSTSKPTILPWSWNWKGL